MRWFNHTLIAAAPVALVKPSLVPVAILGATAPDWLEWIAQALRQPVQHRGATHVVTSWLLLISISLFIPDPASGVLLALGWGGLSHCLSDALTVSGVPFAPHSERRFHLMGGRMRTGGTGEHLTAWAIVFMCWLVHGQLTSPGGGYLPFFPNWAERYEDGTATAKEWRDNRFRFF